MKTYKIYFCPKCKSTNIKFIFALKNMFGIIPKQKCIDCGTELMVFPQIQLTKDQIKKINQKHAGKNR